MFLQFSCSKYWHLAVINHIKQGRIVPVTDGWAGAEKCCFGYRRTDRPTNTASSTVACPRLEMIKISTATNKLGGTSIELTPYISNIWYPNSFLLYSLYLRYDQRQLPFSERILSWCDWQWWQSWVNISSFLRYARAAICCFSIVENMFVCLPFPVDSVFVVKKLFNKILIMLNCCRSTGVILVLEFQNVY